ncbi:DUF305 domain-containing protein [soil metagenome]
MTSLLSVTPTRIVAVFAALVTALVISGCSSPPASDGHTDPTHGETAPVISGQPAGFNADDIAFASGMVPHHQQAVDMSALVPQRSTDPEVIALARKISAAQEPQIETLKAFLVQWQENPADDTGHGDHGGMAMNGMVDDATMKQLESLKGAEFDKLWLQSMIGHHQGAIEMSNTEIAKGDNADAKSLAQHIVADQQAEIAQMKQMLGTS